MSIQKILEIKPNFKKLKILKYMLYGPKQWFFFSRYHNEVKFIKKLNYKC